MKNNSFIIKGNIHNLRSLFSDCIELGISVSDVPFHDPLRRSEIRCLTGNNSEPIVGFATIPHKNFEFTFILPNQYTAAYNFIKQLKSKTSENYQP